MPECFQSLHVQRLDVATHQDKMPHLSFFTWVTYPANLKHWSDQFSHFSNRYRDCIPTERGLTHHMHIIFTLLLHIYIYSWIYLYIHTTSGNVSPQLLYESFPMIHHWFVCLNSCSRCCIQRISDIIMIQPGFHTHSLHGTSLVYLPTTLS